MKKSSDTKEWCNCFRILYIDSKKKNSSYKDMNNRTILEVGFLKMITIKKSLNLH